MASSAGPKSKRVFAESWVCDVRRAESELGFVAAKSLVERIDQTLRDYRADGWL